MSIHSTPLKTAIIIDDEAQSRRTLRLLLADYCPDVEILGEAAGVAEGVRLIRQLKPDLILLDVQMEDGTGFDLLDKFHHPDFQVIFTTAFDEHALKAFRYNAIDYLLKPIDIDELMQAVDKTDPAEPKPSPVQVSNLLEMHRSGNFDKIAISTSEGLHFVELDSIVRLAADMSYTTFHLLTGERITVAKTLKNFEELLPLNAFFRPHQSHIVNLSYVKKVLKEDGGYLLMRDECKVPVSRGKKEELFELVKKRFLS